MTSRSDSGRPGRVGAGRWPPATIVAVAVAGLPGMVAAAAAARAAMAALNSWGSKKACPGKAWGVAVKGAGAGTGSSDTRRKASPLPLIAM